MFANSQAADYTLVPQFPEQKRPVRTRTKTRCLTCKIRKIRCDEQKPACQRCISTGRKCDGYGDETSSSTAASRHPSDDSSTRVAKSRASSAAPRQLRVALPRKNEQEMRSFRFFLDVTVPTIAGVFDVDFWLTHVPQTCHIDIAIWHAVVGLGAVHENFLENPQKTAHNGPMEVFALKQLNIAIGHLVRPSTDISSVTEKWRALTVSIIFTYLCNLQGLYYESSIHLTAANNILEELHKKKVWGVDSEDSETKKGLPGATLQAKFGPTSIPYESLCSTIASLDINAKSLQNNADHGASVIFGDSVSYLTWKFYRAPTLAGGSTLCRHGKAMPSRATTANLNHAGRAMRSLLNEIVISSRSYRLDQARLVLGREYSLLPTLIRYQEAASRAFGELSKALDMFIKDTTIKCSCFAETHLYSGPTQQQKKAVGVLTLYHKICYTMFLEKPQFVDLAYAMDDIEGIFENESGPNHRRDQYLQLDPNPELVGLANFSRMLDLAEIILRDEQTQVKTNDPLNFTPMLPITVPLLIMAHIGWITTELRRRIIYLLRRYPRRELFMDSRFAAALVEFILNEELTAENPGSAQDTGEADALEIGDGAPIGNRICGATVDFMEGHVATITLETWGNWLDEKPGRKEVLMW